MGRHLDPHLPRLQNTPDTAPDSPQPAPENPAKRPDSGAGRKSVLRGFFAKIRRIYPLIRIAKKAFFSFPAYTCPIKRRSAKRNTMATVSGGVGIRRFYGRISTKNWRFGEGFLRRKQVSGVSRRVFRTCRIRRE